MKIPRKEELPAALQRELEAIQNAATLAALMPRFQRMKTFMDMLPQALEERLVADRHVINVRPLPSPTDPRILRLAAATANCWNLMLSPTPGSREIGSPAEMVRGLQGLVGMLQLHLGERLGLLELIEGPEHPWDWEHPVRYRSALPDLPEQMVRRGLWDPNPERAFSFAVVEPPEAP